MNRPASGYHRSHMKGTLSRSPAGQQPGPPVSSPSQRLIPLLGLACGITVSALYFNQPLLIEMARSLHVTEAQMSHVAVAAQAGYAVGLLFFVPLGDVLERRGLMMRMYAAVAIALVLVAVAPSLQLLIAGSVVIGIFAS